MTDHAVDSADEGGLRARVTLTVPAALAAKLASGAHVDVVVHGADGFAALVADADVELTTPDGTPLDASAPGAGASGSADDTPATPRKAIISMESTDPRAERMFREAVVTLDGIPGVEITGISPLYSVTNFDGPDAFTAVATVSAKLGPKALLGALQTIESGHDGRLDLDIVDYEGVTSDDPELTIPWPSAMQRAAILSPLLDLDEDAHIGKEPVSFLLAMANDAPRVGALSANWILGGGV
ncbi:2-amino-4-hydroxy-6-hydroxymethyldihydropteridine diphosphokinase [Bifidobacterium avesanii]|uniref:2-amino-4-hydroxy-6-hydroxymethyldihydropteridine diphosphokinase n=1 Tax=Bifidobacterium avesanii TaxID=1798157 RepID=A0A7K3TJ61_9BIFI|nr:2-amino-4-hydroxy-6-hydroxymethyldihydropteridine diphosphokinase [Bifidobacterium avesanii]KAB8289592.1 2-amino-4-hydroxy-6- hydroxymethyldihydropteridin e pyrophosphokinase [Bifidobacterium avesanii]NEG79145.1 hypothetical protein [Bifidobacterium avesanii]